MTIKTELVSSVTLQDEAGSTYGADKFRVSRLHKAIDNPQGRWVKSREFVTLNGVQLDNQDGGQHRDNASGRLFTEVD